MVCIFIFHCVTVQTENRNFLLMVFRNISKINGADTLTPSEITLKAPPQNRLFEAFREWSMGKIVCGYEMERFLGPKRECFPPPSRATRINSQFSNKCPYNSSWGRRTKGQGPWISPWGHEHDQAPASFIGTKRTSQLFKFPVTII